MQKVKGISSNFGPVSNGGFEHFSHVNFYSTNYPISRTGILTIFSIGTHPVSRKLKAYIYILTVRLEFCTSPSKQPIAKTLNTSSCHHFFVSSLNVGFKIFLLIKLFIVQIPPELKKIVFWYRKVTLGQC